MEEHVGTRDSQVFRQDGRTSGHGALDASAGSSDGPDPGETDVAAGTEELSVIVDSGEGIVAGNAGIEVADAGVKVVGGASVHLVQTVAVDVMTVCVKVREVVVKVLEPEVLVRVTGHKVVVVKMISVVMMSEVAGVVAKVSGIAIEPPEGTEIAVDASGTIDSVTDVDDDSATDVGTGSTDVGIDSAGAVSV